ncbi:hypothetical protein F5Y13DRAFT_155014 [Hypoxylon sp. FL1857]|nr:hypothetical protein F5Y13DRAFT_155014 [Hypoxylon sp. FL1857]
MLLLLLDTFPSFTASHSHALPDGSRVSSQPKRMTRSSRPQISSCFSHIWLFNPYFSNNWFSCSQEFLDGWICRILQRTRMRKYVLWLLERCYAGDRAVSKIFSTAMMAAYQALQLSCSV